jgi:hypothetical protein
VITLTSEERNVPRETILESARAGVCQLLGNASDTSLVSFYAALLAGRRSLSDVRRPPAMLVTASPLTPDALGALLLPLDRAIADGLSLAGWIVSSAYYERMADMWDGIAWSRVPREFSAPVAEAEIALAKDLVDRLRTTKTEDTPATAPEQRRPEPSRVRSRGVAGPSPRGGVSRPVEEIASFAESPAMWRMFPPQRHGALTAAERERLNQAIVAFRGQLDASTGLPQDLRDARRRHLQAKLELVRRVTQQIDSSVGGDWTID